MGRKKLSIHDIAGEMMKGHEQEYQTILSNYRSEKVKCNDYKPELKGKKLLEVQDKYLKQAGLLKEKCYSELMGKLESKRKELISKQENKNKPLDIDSIFSDAQGFMTQQEEHNSRMKAMKTVYNAIEKNSKILMANSILKTGDIKLIEPFLKANIEDKEITNLIESNLKNANKLEYTELIKEITDSRLTEVDDIEEIIKSSKTYYDVSEDVFKTGVAPNQVHDFNKDFDQKQGLEKWFQDNKSPNQPEGIEKFAR